MLWDSCQDFHPTIIYWCLACNHFPTHVGHIAIAVNLRRNSSWSWSGPKLKLAKERREGHREFFFWNRYLFRFWSDERMEMSKLLNSFFPFSSPFYFPYYDYSCLMFSVSVSVEHSVSLVGFNSILATINEPWNPPTSVQTIAIAT